MQEPAEPQIPPMEKVDVHVQTEVDSLLQIRRRNEELVTQNDLSVYGADMAQFFKRKDAKKHAKIAMNEAIATYK